MKTKWNEKSTADKIKAEQEEWLTQQNNNLQKIRDEVDEEDAMAAMTVAEKYYAVLPLPCH